MKTLQTLIVLSIALAASMVGAEEPSDPWAENMLLGAHRGGAGQWPENTLLAFTEGAKAYPDMLLEGDLQLSADGQVILIHDKNLDRTTNGSGLVKNSTLAELKALDAGHDFESPKDSGEFPYRGKGVSIPTLAEVLTALPDKRFLLELKDGDGITPAALKVIREHKAEDRILLASFNPTHMAQVHKRAPDMAVCYDLSTAMGMLQALRKGDWEAYTPTARVLSLPKRYIGIFKLTPEELTKIKAKGIVIQVHTLNTAESMQKYIDMGVDSILTDYPDMLQKVIQQNN